MTSKKIVIVAVLVILLIAVAIPLVRFLQQTALESGYSYYDDFTIPSPAVLQGSGSDETWKVSGCKFSYQDNDLHIGPMSGDSKDACTGTLTATKNLKGYDFKTAIKVMTTGARGDSADVSARISINNRNIEGISITLPQRSADQEKSQFLELIQNRAEKGNYTIYLNGQEKGKVSAPEENTTFAFEYRLSVGRLIIDNVQIRPFFNCQVQDDEIVIKDEFLGPQTITVNDLSYPPLKFCTDSFPAVIRDVSKGFAPDLRGDITRKLAGAENIVIPEGQVYTIGYIADFVEGIHTRCALGLAWRKGKCEQYITEKPDFAEVIRDVKFIEVGLQQVIFTNSGMIGDMQLTSSPALFSCQEEIRPTDSATAPKPREQCWLIPGNFQSQFKLPYGAEIQLNDYFTITAFTNARYKQGQVEPFDNTLLLRLKDLSMLETKAKTAVPYYVILNHPSKLCFSINNKANNFPSAGARVKVENKLLNEEEVNLLNFAIEKGNKDYCIDLKTSQLGKFQYTINPFIELGGKQFFDDQSVVYTLEVVQKVPEESLLVNKTLEQQERELKQKSAPIAYIALFVSLAAVIALVWYLRKVYRK